MSTIALECNHSAHDSEVRLISYSKLSGVSQRSYVFDLVGLPTEETNDLHHIDRKTKT